MKVPFADLKWQHEIIKDAIQSRFNTIFAKTAFILGPDVAEFEESFAQYCGSGYAVGVSSGTTALQLALESLGLPNGGKVVTLPASFFASASAIIHARLQPLFCDIDASARYDIEKLETLCREHSPVAIVVVHLYGRPERMDQIMRIAHSHGIPVIEDASQAHGAKYEGRRVGSFGTVAAFSCYPGKNLGAYGEAGVVTTNDSDLADKIRRLRNHGCLGKYDHDVLGYNAKMDTLQAAVLIEKLKHLDEWNEMRRCVGERYDQAFCDSKKVRPIVTQESNFESVRHLYPIEICGGSRDLFVEHLKEKEVATNIHYPEALHTTRAFKELGFVAHAPVSEKLSKNIVSLPLFPGMSPEAINHVIESVLSYEA